MSKKSVTEYLRAIRSRYMRVSRKVRQLILDEFCSTTGYNRKYVIRKLHEPLQEESKKPRKRRPTYGSMVISILASVWEAAGYPCSTRLKALLVLWMPWIRKHYALSREIEAKLLRISPRQMDRRLKSRKLKAGRRLYGRTKPGTLLKHQIPIKTDHWDVTSPGWTEVDTVSHSGNNADGLFAYTVNQTDILTTWVESRAVLGKGEKGVGEALDEMEQDFPFSIKGIDSDNGSEFVNWHLYRRCKEKKIQPFRGRPYKKDDNAHIEQKNWTHVRKLIGWDRYDTPEAVAAMNDLYRNELRLLMNLFLPSTKLLRKKRVGSKLIRVYDKPKTPFQRVEESKQVDKQKMAVLRKIKDGTDPFALMQTVEAKLQRIYKLAHRGRQLDSGLSQKKNPNSLSTTEIQDLQALSRILPDMSANIDQTGQPASPR